MSAFSVENPHNGKTFENYTRFEWDVEVSVVTTFMLKLFVPHEFDMAIYRANGGNVGWACVYMQKMELRYWFKYGDGKSRVK